MRRSRHPTPQLRAISNPDTGTGTDHFLGKLRVLLSRHIAALLEHEGLKAGLKLYPETRIFPHWVTGFRLRYQICLMLLRVWWVMLPSSANLKPTMMRRKYAAPETPSDVVEGDSKYYVRLKPNHPSAPSQHRLNASGTMQKARQATQRGIKPNAYYQRLIHMQQLLARTTHSRYQSEARDIANITRKLKRLSKLRDVAIPYTRQIEEILQHYWRRAPRCDRNWTDPIPIYPP